MQVSLEELLESRDLRVRHQQELQAAFPESTLICLTVQLPGAVKRSSHSLIVGGAGMTALLEKFGSVLSHAQVRDLETGYEAYLAVKLPAALVKRLCVSIEEDHPLGRLMDIDVMGCDRASLGIAPRRCLLCDNEARYCMRARAHTREALMEKIDRMIGDYIR